MLETLIAFGSPLLIKLILPLVLTAVLGLLARGQLKSHQLIDTEIKNKTVTSIVDKLDDATFAVVRFFAQTVVSDAKDSGTFDAALAAKVKADAVAALRAKFTPEEIPTLLSYFGIIDSAQLPTALGQHIEAVVHTVNSGAAGITAANANAVLS